MILRGTSKRGVGVDSLKVSNSKGKPEVEGWHSKTGLWDESIREKNVCREYSGKNTKYVS